MLFNIAHRSASGALAGAVHLLPDSGRSRPAAALRVWLLLVAATFCWPALPMWRRSAAALLSSSSALSMACWTRVQRPSSWVSVLLCLQVQAGSQCAAVRDTPEWCGLWG